ncbi:hypothetical protein NPIL_133701 [Nephila pilipes]|uniref:Uncharacterized protein n=1 Tax=Nephila pilipes TaxID=299642 RepID=A0A8X6QGR8_NEPPI|nr:hypothetical protein NPIL_133701 [Nephila pilipes]
MSDPEFSPPKQRNNLPLHIDCCDFQFKEREPKCVNSLCNLINTRLKLLENEIFAQHKVWEYIQREVDEVKSLIEDCTSTCDSSSLSGHENESEIVDSALESHKTCNSFLWDKIKQAEENVEEKKSLMQLISSDVLKLKSSKKKCKRKLEKASSNIDLILEVTNGLHALKCDDCKFCSEHLDFREGLLSSVIELIHFSEKNYNNCLEENKTLKACLQKIYMKTKRCLLHSQIYVRNTQFQQLAYEHENSSFCTDSIYSSFEEFCQHFQNLQEELMQLKHILLAAEESHLDEVFQSSHSSDCKCYSHVKKRDLCLESEFDTNEIKLTKSNEKNACYYEKKIKTLSCCDEPENTDPDVMYETNTIFGATSNDANKQLANLRSRIFEAVSVIRDVEVEENDDENLINMVTSLSEECSALRQEVSYLRNVRQEKKRAWNKLQCFIMDAERKLKGSSRNISGLREVIKDLGHMISTSDSSSLDETVLYMYTNQLEWIEKVSMGCESPSDQQDSCDESISVTHESAPLSQIGKSVNITVSTQTLIELRPDQEEKETEFLNERNLCDIAVQTEYLLCPTNNETSLVFAPTFQEISREIYVVPEVSEESDSCMNNSLELSCSGDKMDDINIIDVSDDNTVVEINYSSDCQKISVDNNLNSQSESESSSCIIPLSGSFPAKFYLSSNGEAGKTVFPVLNIKMNSPLFKESNISLLLSDFQISDRPASNTFNYLSDANIFMSMFFNTNINIAHNVLHNMLKDNVKSIEICDQDNNWSCTFHKSNIVPLSSISAGSSIACLPYEQCNSLETNDNNFVMKEIPSDEAQYNTHENVSINDDIETSCIVSDFQLLSSMPNETEPMPNINDEDETDTIVNDEACPDLSSVEVCNTDIEASEEDNPVEDMTFYSNNDDCNFTLERSGTFVCEKPLSACREGTFIIDSKEKLILNEKNVSEESLCCTAILTAVMSNETQQSGKNYVLYEVNNPLNNSMLLLQSVNPYLEANINDQQLPCQHFMLCEAVVSEENMNPQTFAPKASCYVVFFKPNVKDDDKPINEDTADNISGFYPLLPQYLPSESLSFHNFDQFSLAQSCEIYMCNQDNCKLENNPESTAFIPKNYFKFKESFPVEQSESNFLSQDSALGQTVYKQNLLPTFSESFEENCDVNLNVQKDSHEKDLSEITNGTTFIESFSDSCETGTQTDELCDSTPNEMHTLERLSDLVEEPEHDASTEIAIVDIKSEHESASIIKEQNKIEYYANPSQSVVQEQIQRETSLLDEIEALKDNLNQQNAVLLRLKEELEDSNFRLAEKEQLLVLLQLEHSRLNSLLIENGIREIEEKECQTELNENIDYEALKEEVQILRQKNLQHYEKISHQHNTIQSVKSQLSSTISHLKHLKDAATKQLKKQKHQITKTLKLKQQLHDTKIDLERKCMELEKKNEKISDQEFHLNELLARMDSTNEEYSGKVKETTELSSDLKKVDCGCQTDAINIADCENQDNASLLNQQCDVILKKHSEELLSLQAKFHRLESVLSNKKENKVSVEENIKSIHEMKTSNLKEGNIWKLLTVSEQSYLSLLNKLAETLQLSDLKGSSALMHSSWLNCDDLADARRQDHKKILQSLEKMKKNIRYLQETLNLEPKRQNVENISSDERKPNSLCHSEEMHYQYLCEVLQKAQENLIKEYSQRRSSYRTVGTAGSGRTSRHAGSRERRIPLELKNGKILAILDDKLSHKELLPSKFDYSKIECKAGNSSSKSKTPS